MVESELYAESAVSEYNANNATVYYPSNFEGGQTVKPWKELWESVKNNIHYDAAVAGEVDFASQAPEYPAGPSGDEVIVLSTRVAQAINNRAYAPEGYQQLVLDCYNFSDSGYIGLGTENKTWIFNEQLHDQVSVMLCFVSADGSDVFDGNVYVCGDNLDDAVKLNDAEVAKVACGDQFKNQYYIQFTLNKSDILSKKHLLFKKADGVADVDIKGCWIK